MGFDDKIGRKPLRFKCDAHSETCTDAVASATCFDAVADSAAGDPCCLRDGAQIGVFGCTPVGLETGMEDYERDYAERTSEEIVNLMQRSCAPRGEALDVKWFESVLARVAGIVVDGALQKKRGGGQQQFRGDGQSAGCISCSGMVERATDASVRRRAACSEVGDSTPDLRVASATRPCSAEFGSVCA